MSKEKVIAADNSNLNISIRLIYEMPHAKLII